MTSTDSAARLRQAAAVLIAVDQYLAHNTPALPDSITDAQWDAVAEIPTGIRRTLAAWLETAAVNTAALTWPNDFIERTLAVADSILGEVTR